MQIRESNCLNCNAFEETDDGPFCEYKDEFISTEQVSGGCCDEWEPNDEELQSVLEQENSALRAKCPDCGAGNNVCAYWEFDEEAR